MEIPQEILNDHIQLLWNMDWATATLWEVSFNFVAQILWFGLMAGFMFTYLCLGYISFSLLASQEINVPSSTDDLVNKYKCTLSDFIQTGVQIPTFIWNCLTWFIIGGAQEERVTETETVKNGNEPEYGEDSNDTIDCKEEEEHHQKGEWDLDERQQWPSDFNGSPWLTSDDSEIEKSLLSSSSMPLTTEDFNSAVEGPATRTRQRTPAKRCTSTSVVKRKSLRRLEN